MFYFAYGSNMDLKRIEDLGLRIYCLKPGFLPDWKLVFNVIDDPTDKSGYANIVPDRRSRVEGLIIETNIASRQKLDINESVPNFYLRKKVVVFDRDKKPYECLTYIGQPKHLRDDLKPRQAYLNHLLKGQLFLPVKYIDKLKATKTLD